MPRGRKKILNEESPVEEQIIAEETAVEEDNYIPPHTPIPKAKLQMIKLLADEIYVCIIRNEEAWGKRINGNKKHLSESDIKLEPKEAIKRRIIMLRNALAELSKLI